LLTLNNITYEIAGVPLFSDVNWQVVPGDRVGLVGKNGAGKSTLLKIITKEYSPTTGDIALTKGIDIGFLNQDLLSFQSDESILKVAMSAFEKELALEHEIEELISGLEIEYDEDKAILMAEKQDEFNTLDGYSIQSKAEKVLEGLGFATERLEQPLSSFSGGWRMRVILAKMLLKNPEILLLDEPTNHLDLPAIEWLENYLMGYPGAVVIVSHDRIFLDKMVNAIGELWNGKFYYYPGNYSNYITKKEESMEHHQKVFDNQQTFIKEQERFIERFKAKASKSTQAQSRVKMLDKLDRVSAVESDEASMNLRFAPSAKSGKEVAIGKDICKSYGPIDLLDQTEFAINRGDKIALIGANGKGKSTLLKIIAQTVEFDGTLQLGYNVIKSFYAQHQLESLNVENEILQELQQCGTAKTDLELRTVLGCFLFVGDDSFKKIKVLSGGEKARVALAKTLISGANFLLLDEPTNHLDIKSINILAQALKNFDGTYIMVSHDRFFIQEVANKIWFIENQELKEYPGTYAEFNEWFAQRTVTAPKEKKKIVAEKIMPVQETTNDDFLKQREIEKAKKSAERNLEELDNKINGIKVSISSLDKEIEKFSYDGKFEEIEKINSNRHKLEQELNSLNKAYESQFEEVLKY